MPDPFQHQPNTGEQTSSSLLLQILSQQQQLMAKLSDQVSATHRAISELNRDEIALDSLSSNITEFTYDPEHGNTFDAWFSRYEDLFDKDAGKLDDSAKVRLLMRKLNPAAHDRYQCLQTIKEDGEDFVSYSCKVNKACVDAKIREMTDEQFKCLIFVSGLKSHRDSDIRMRLINKITDTVDITLQKVVEECKSLENLKQDNSLVEKQHSATSVNAVQQHSFSKPNYKQPSSKSANNHPKTPCWSCGGMHFNRDCPYREHQCRDYRKKGHKEGYCTCFLKKTPGKKKFQPKNKTCKVVSVKSVNQRRKYAEVLINNCPVRLQIDSASDITIISDTNWRQLGQPLGQAPCDARTASGEPLDLALEFWAEAQIGGVTKSGLCRVASANLNLNILGSDWLDLFGLWDVPISAYCNQVNTTSQSSKHFWQTKFPKVFTESMGLCTKVKAQLTLKGNPKPVFRPKRPVSYSMQAAVEDELHRLESLGILQAVDHSDWAAPIVAVRKPTGKIRICADFSTGLNAVLEPNQYPLPRPEDIFAKMSGCKFFSHIDLSDAYLQVEVDQRDQQLLTINTHLGLFRYTRLSPGVKSAPGAFQKIIDTIIANLELCCGYLDDLIVGGRTVEEQNRNVDRILGKLEEFGFTVRIEKCNFNMRQVKYLGQILDGDGIRPDPDKTAAIASMPAPHDVLTLRSYLGAVNYYAKYVPEMRKLRYPMDQLLKAGTPWEWSHECQQAFNRFREILQSPLALMHYNPDLEIIVSADASQYGIGAQIAHKLPDGHVKAICHACRSLTPAESNYSQIEKEGLALVFAVTRFHRMIFGRRFTLETDHKPLLSIFGSKQGIPTYTANRLQRWALTLLLHDFSITYINTDSFGYADILSRLINKHTRPNEDYVIASIELEDSMNEIVKQSLEFLPITFKVV
ncbi:uncharacterized protein K02A2.6-like [Uranotaenia lowii]|uniref:uncharacterized protein K02A2.6-like n=1 Tax=Uranotaenia lowii TaxID=190385 RepID=UPI002478C2C7|nr:uncharacterized protein K02A2.6-like [Uranotaenia lowii]